MSDKAKGFFVVAVLVAIAGVLVVLLVGLPDSPPESNERDAIASGTPPDGDSGPPSTLDAASNQAASIPQVTEASEPVFDGEGSGDRVGTVRPEGRETDSLPERSARPSLAPIAERPIAESVHEQYGIALRGGEWSEGLAIAERMIQVEATRCDGLASAAWAAVLLRQYESASDYLNDFDESGCEVVDHFSLDALHRARAGLDELFVTFSAGAVRDLTRDGYHAQAVTYALEWNEAEPRASAEFCRGIAYAGLAARFASDLLALETFGAAFDAHCRQIDLPGWIPETADELGW